MGVSWPVSDMWTIRNLDIVGTLPLRRQTPLVVNSFLSASLAPGLVYQVAKTDNDE